MKPRLLPLTGVAILQAVCLTAAVHAQNYTWTGGGGDRLWSNGANWSGGAPPTGSNLTSLTFSGEAPFSDPAENDLPGAFLLNRVDFTGLTGEFHTDGGNLQFLNGAPPPVISQNSAFTASLGGSILMDSVNNWLDITGSGAGALRLGGLLTNKQYVRVNRGADTYTALDGGLVNSGMLVVNTGTLGLWKGITNTGEISVASTLVFSGDDSYHMERGGTPHGNAGSRIEFAGGAVNFNDAGEYAMRSRGTVALTGSGLGGAADFTLGLSDGGAFDWRAGGFTGTAAQKATVKLKTGLIDGPSAKTISRSLTLDGGVTSWNGGDLDLGATGNLTLNNTTIKASGLAGNVTASGADNLLILTSLSSLQKISGDATVMEIQPAVSAGFGTSFVTSAGGITFPKGGTFNSRFTASGTGYFEFTGTTNLLGSARIIGGPDALRLTSGAFNFNEDGGQIEAGVILESGVILGGTASLFGIGSFPGSAFKWNGGTISGPAGSVVPIGGQSILATAATKTIDTRGVYLANGLWTGGDIVLKDSVLGVNEMIVQSDQSISRTGSTGGLIITGFGLTKNTTTGTTTINVPVDLQVGGIRANTGRILLTGGGAAIGKFESITGGTVEFGGGNYEINNMVGFGGSGALGSRGVGNFLISAGEVRINVANSTVNNFAALTLAPGGTLAGTTASYNMGGTAFTWTGGSIKGPAGSSMHSFAPWTISGAATKTIDNRSASFTNGTWTGGDITLKDAGLTVGSLTVQSDQAINRAGTTGGVTVTTLFAKDTTAGTTTINAPVTLQFGSMRALTGRLLLTSGGAATGPFLSTADGTVEFGGGNFEINANGGFGGISGAGNFLISAGEVRVNRAGLTVNQSADLTLAPGATLGGTAASYTLAGNAFHWTGGSITGPGGSGMAITAPTTISGSAVKTIDTRNVSLSNGVWTGGDIVLKDGGLTVESLTVQSDQAISRTGTSGGLTVNGAGIANGIANATGLIKNTTTGTTALHVPVTLREGVVRADTGRILLTGGGVANGGLFLSSGAGLIEFGGGNFDFDNAYGFGGIGSGGMGGGAGNFLISAGVVRINTNATTVNTVASLTLAEGGTLGGSAAGYTLSGNTFQWTGGSITGPAGSGVRVSAPATISGSAVKTVDTRNVNLSNTSSWTGGDITLKDADLTVYQMSVQSDQAINRTGTTGGLTVTRGFVKDTTTGTTTINVPVTLLGGSMRADTGRILLTGGGTGTVGSFLTTAGGTVEFGGGNYEFNNSEFNNSVGFGGAGNFLISTGEVRINGTPLTVNESGRLTLVSGAALGGTAPSYGLSGAAFNWTGGTISGPADSRVGVRAPTTISGSAVKTIDRRNVNISGAASWTGGDILLKDANLYVGQMTVRSDQAINRTGTTGGLTVFNGFLKDTTAGTTTINVPVTLQAGNMRATTGRILLTGGGSTAGRSNFVADPGATVEFGGGAYELDDNNGGLSGGGNFLISAGEVRVNQGGLGSGVNLTLVSGGALGGTARVYSVGGGSFQWTGGSITGPAGSSVILYDPMISGSATKTLDTRNAITNSGTWSGGDIILAGGAQLELRGFTDNTFQAPNTLGGAGTLVNTHGLIKSTSSVTTIAAAFTNNSSVLINEGTLRVDSTMDGSGYISVGAAGTLGGRGVIRNYTYVSGKVAPGASPGLLTLAGHTTFYPGSTYDWELGALSDTAAGGAPGTDWDMLSGAGTAIITFEPGSELTLNFYGIPDPGSPGAFWDGVTDRSWLIASSTGGLVNQGMVITNPKWNYGDFSLSGDGKDLYLNFAAVPEPGAVSVIGVGVAALLLPRRRRRDP